MKSIAIVIPTYNRSDQIQITLESIKNARLPEKVDLGVYLIDNNSTESHSKNYKSLIEYYEREFRIYYFFEKNQGRSHALNRGIAESHEEVIAFIDDDERIDADWLHALFCNFEDADIDYIGGPCLPDWEEKAPAWLPAHIGQYQGLLGWIEQSTKRIGFDDFNGELCGGNCGVRRSVIAEVGGFNTALGRKANDLAGGEDGEFHRRLKSSKKYGVYEPNLIIYHLISKARMTYKYHLRWAFWSGISNGIRISNSPNTKEGTPHVFGVPRYWYKKAFSGAISAFWQSITFNFNKSPKGISGIMDTFYFFGFFYGRHGHM